MSDAVRPEAADLPSRWRRIAIKLRAAWRHPGDSRKRKRFRETATARLWLVPPAPAVDAVPDPRPPADARLFRVYVDNAMGRYDPADYLPERGSAFAGTPSATVMAYYLPQFHPIAENDAWWGPGFTEWRNVARAFPTFEGHYQPRIPGELGYYDLRLPEVMRRQVELARRYAVAGFCFHFYWFGGKRLLEAPILQFLADKDLDLRFSLCWANENWSRRWDGGNNDLLIRQDHSPEDDVAFLRYLDRYFRDDRYLKIAGRPVLTVYHPAMLPDAAATIARWRAEAERLGYPGLYLIATTAFAFSDAQALGFDALSEFPPHNTVTPTIDHTLAMSSLRTGGAVFSYDEHVAVERAKPARAGIVHPGVFPAWDNSARKPTTGIVFHEASPAAFGRWLDHAFAQAHSHPPDRRLVFINAWNEWAEGAYLEPDARFGYAWLEAVREAVRRNAQG